jgi:hypothetical protein
MAFTIVRSVATKMTSSLAGAAGSPWPPEGTSAAHPDSAAAVKTGPSRCSICRFMTRVYAATERNTASAVMASGSVEAVAGGRSYPWPKQAEIPRLEVTPHQRS